MKKVDTKFVGKKINGKVEVITANDIETVTKYINGDFELIPLTDTYLDKLGLEVSDEFKKIMCEYCLILPVDKSQPSHGYVYGNVLICKIDKQTERMKGLGTIEELNLAENIIVNICSEVD